MIRRPPRSTRTDTLFPDTTLFRSRRIELAVAVHARVGGVEQQMEFPRSRGRLDSLAADHDMAGARLQPKPVERRFPQCRGDQPGQIVGDRPIARRYCPLTPAAQAALRGHLLALALRHPEPP